MSADQRTRVIWKFRHEILDKQFVEIPNDFEVLHIADQPRVGWCLWALVDPSAPRIRLPVVLYSTGQPMPHDPGRHLGSFMLHEGSLVFHAFDARD